MEYMKGRKIMEINPDHDVIKGECQKGRKGGLKLGGEGRAPSPHQATHHDPSRLLRGPRLHSLTRSRLGTFASGLKTLLEEKDEDRARDLAELLFETSLLTSGFQVCVGGRRVSVLPTQRGGLALLPWPGRGRASVCFHLLFMLITLCSFSHSPAPAVEPRVGPSLNHLPCPFTCKLPPHVKRPRPPLYLQVDSPREYAAKVFTLMKIALGYDIGEEAPSTTDAAPASEQQRPQKPLQQVEAEVSVDDGARCVKPVETNTRRCGTLSGTCDLGKRYQELLAVSIAVTPGCFQCCNRSYYISPPSGDGPERPLGQEVGSRW